MKIADGTLSRLFLHAAAGQAEEAREYLGHIIRRTDSLADFRDALAVRAPGFLEAFLEALPWLALDTLAAGDPATPPQDVEALLKAAEGRGLPKSDLDQAALAPLMAAGEVLRFERATGGRPKAWVRWWEFDPRVNPFAPPVD